MSSKRDYKAEYQRRIASAKRRGLSRSQARGHAKAGEARLKSTPAINDANLIAALAAFEQGQSVGQAAKSAGVSSERFSRFLQDQGLVTKTERRWRFVCKPYCDMLVISNGNMAMHKLASFEQASLNGKFLNAFQRFLDTNDTARLQPFIGRVVIDAKGIAHPFETDPNTLFRIWHRDADYFPEIYRLTS